ncbi:hypothetical protein Tco_1117804 [Tanacetum coccineum]
MDGINIDDLTIEQYLRLTLEHQTLSIGILDPTFQPILTIAHPAITRPLNFLDMELDEETRYTTDEESVMSEHEAIDPIHAVNTQSFKEELSSEEDLDEWVVHKNKQIRVVEANLKSSFDAMDDTINNDSLTSNSPSLEELNP